MALHLVGGVHGLFDQLTDFGLTEFPHLMRPLNDRDFPWLGTLTALFIGGLRCWCLDQEMAQRILSARNLHHARFGTAGAACLKLLPLFLTSMPKSDFDESTTWQFCLEWWLDCFSKNVKAIRPRIPFGAERN